MMICDFRLICMIMMWYISHLQGSEDYLINGLKGALCQDQPCLKTLTLADNKFHRRFWVELMHLLEVLKAHIKDIANTSIKPLLPTIYIYIYIYIYIK